MPLSPNDPALDYDGSWADASKEWPSISFPSEEEAKNAYTFVWRVAKVPYGSYVLVGNDLRLETPELKKLVECELRIQSAGDQEKLLADAEEIAADEVADTDALLADLKTAMDALGQAFNRLSPSTEPVRCIVQGRVETAMETVEEAFNLIKGLEQ